MLLILIAGCATQTELIPPRRIHSPVLDYPPEAILERQSGTLVVWLNIGPDGVIRERKVQRSTGYPVLDEAGLYFVDRLEFLPAVKRGARQACWAEQKVIFSLEKAPLDLHQWRTSTLQVIEALEQARPDEREALEGQLYSKCAEYMRAAITTPELLMNRLALSLAVDPVREQWAPHKETFPMSFLMFADFCERIRNPALRDQALRQLRQCLQVDIQRVDQRLSRGEDPALRQLKDSMAAYLGHLR